MNERITSNTIYEAFRKYLVKQLRPVVEDNVIHVGEVVTCLRKSYLARKYGNSELSHLSKTKLIVMGLGLSVHNVLEDVLREMGYRTEEQITKDVTYKDSRFKIIGTPDAFNEKRVLEIKTVRRLPDRPYEHHLMQLNAYLWMLDMNTGYIIYICKHSGEVRVYEHRISYSMLQTFLDRALTLYKCITSKKIPKRESTHLCNYCEWRLKCDTIIE